MYEKLAPTALASTVTTPRRCFPFGQLPRRAARIALLTVHIHFGRTLRRFESGRQEKVQLADSAASLTVFASCELAPETRDHADAAGRLCWKHSRHSTGRPCVGLNGTVVSLPHCEHTARVSVLEKPVCPGLADPRTATRFALQVLHRLGSFLNCLSWKNNCSPEVKTKSVPQSTHFNILSWNSIEGDESKILRTRARGGFRLLIGA